jgi:hypothetical protein
MMKKAICVAMILASAIGGCVQRAYRFWEPDDTIKAIAIQTCKQWIPGSLDLEGRNLDEYHHTVDGFHDASGKRYLSIQFERSPKCTDIICEHLIVASDGGFPDYFSISVSSDGRRVLDHYASRY